MSSRARRDDRYARAFKELEALLSQRSGTLGRAVKQLYGGYRNCLGARATHDSATACVYRNCPGCLHARAFDASRAFR